MEKSAALALFVGWEEIFVTNDKGRKEVHYYLKRKDGGSDLAVVGKERRLRHMSYYYALRNRSVLLSLAPSSSLLKLRSRRDVVDWLSSVVPDLPSHQSSQSADGSLESEDGRVSDRPSFKNLHVQELGHRPKGFSWLGSSWTCKKRRRHYQSFSRNGVTVYVHDFVYIMAEENKRLVAYLEDLYEDTKGNKMVVVRWFHKIDEVGNVSPADFNDREIFFSLCLQDLSVECIDGLATILSAQHFEKFQNEAKHTRLEPFVCHRMVDKDDVKPFDITRVQGYWKQEILRYMYTTSQHRTNVKHGNVDGGLEVEGNGDDTLSRTRPKKRHRASIDEVDHHQFQFRKDVKDAVCGDIHKSSENLVIGHGSADISAPKEGGSDADLSIKEADQQRSHLHLAVGSRVEVFSQDSGIRGCWFRALVLKKRKEKLKVQYQDIRDAADEANYLEEWVLASKVLVPDYLGLRLRGRTAVRPCPPSNKGQVSWSIDAGTVVDAWWCDGWWEGIVVQKESEDRIHVFFPGERQKKIFGHGDLRHSQDWVVNKWKYIKGSPDIASSVLSGLENSRNVGNAGNKANVCNVLPKKGNDVYDLSGVTKDLDVLLNKEAPCFEPRDDGKKDADLLPNLVKDDLLAQLRWKSSRKRRRTRESIPRRGSLDSKHHIDGSSSSSSLENIESPPCERFLNPKSLKLDHENCKYVGDAILNASVPFASLVMSR
ncbi:uncharacterized protein LOC122664576 isoform X2 [Telopea speciosissima]|uniref:uncharacterized protein LOC122664576 isoform X2 n=1 Tax=Telopea speciosissima TaxID=54955 RepID=UPI001CC3685B|nr:uncharacterized protein LOC122664576 isoform X2 [Telopea speciosissima]